MDSINPSEQRVASASELKPSLRGAKKRDVFSKTKPSRFRLMPITITMLSLGFVVKLSDIYADSMDIRQSFLANAQAEEKADAKEEAKKDGEAKESDAKDGKKGDSKDKKDENATSKMSASEVQALKKLKEQTKYNQIELDLLQNLSSRRDELDVREKELGLKEKTLEATEKRITDRIKEMKALQKEVEGLIEAYKQHQDTDVKSLVKIYENMKPASAAEIFNELEMPILLSVIDAMSERKVAPVLAAMNPKRAKEVTEELAELRKVKALPASSAMMAAP